MKVLGISDVKSDIRKAGRLGYFIQLVSTCVDCVDEIQLEKGLGWVPYSLGSILRNIDFYLLVVGFVRKVIGNKTVSELLM